jgi:tetratricopeptide (TPR) repeat protein
LYLWHVQDRAKAAPPLQRSEELWEELVRQHPDVSGYQASLGYIQLQRVQLFRGTVKAVEAARRAVTIGDRLAAAHPENPGNRHLQAMAHRCLGDQLLLAGRPREAELAYRRAVTINQGPVLAEMLLGLATTMMDTGRDVEVEQICRDALSQASRMAKDFPKTVYHQDTLALVQCGLGKALERQNRMQEAETLYRQAVATTRKTVSEAPSISVPYGLDQVMDSHDRLLNLLNEDGRLPEAIQVCREALALCEEIAARSGDLHYPRLGPIRFRMRLACLLRQSDGNAVNTRDEVQRLARLALDDLDAMLRDSNHVSTRIRVVHFANILAWQLGGAPAARVRDADFAVELARRAVAGEPQRADSHKTLGVALYRTRDWKAAALALEKSMELAKGGEGLDGFFLAMSHWQLGNKDDARKWYVQAVAWMDKFEPKNEELRRFRAEAEELMKIEKK